MPFIDALAGRLTGRLALPSLAVLLAVVGCTGSAERGPGEVTKPVPPTSASKPPPLETVKPSPEVAREGAKLPPPRAMRNWDEVRRHRRASPPIDITYTGKVPTSCFPSRCRGRAQCRQRAPDQCYGTFAKETL